MHRWIQLIRFLLRLIPSLYSILPYLQVLTLLDGMSFDWPGWLKYVFLACTTVALNVNLALPHCFGFFPSLTQEWIAYMLVPWLHLFFSATKWYGALRLHKLLRRSSPNSALERMTWFAWLKDEQQLEAYADAEIQCVIWAFYVTTMCAITI